MHIEGYKGEKRFYQPDTRDKKSIEEVKIMINILKKLKKELEEEIEEKNIGARMNIEEITMNNGKIFETK